MEALNWTDVIPHVIFCFQMCNRSPKMMKNGDAGIFPVYYSLNQYKSVLHLAHARKT